MILFSFSADGRSNRGLRELGGAAAGAEVVTLSLYLPKQEKSMPFCCRRSVWINGRFQKASVKNQCPLHAIDGCLAAEERERQRTPVYYEKLLPPTLCFGLSNTLRCFCSFQCCVPVFSLSFCQKLCGNHLLQGRESHVSATLFCFFGLNCFLNES